jgi:hypothetical protein
MKIKLVLGAVLSFTIMTSSAYADYTTKGSGTGYTADLACSTAENEARATADSLCKKQDANSELSKFYGIGKDQKRITDQSFSCVFNAGFTCR